MLKGAEYGTAPRGQPASEEDFSMLADLDLWLGVMANLLTIITIVVAIAHKR
jgi:hypothetical protein